MRVLLLAILLLGFLTAGDGAQAGLSTATGDMSAAIEPATLADQSLREEATQETEDQVGLDRRKRRDVQRRLTRIGFDTKVNGKFDAETRGAIGRWQGASGHPATGFLNAQQHQSLLTESASVANASLGEDPDGDNPTPSHAAHRHRGGVMGGMIGGSSGAGDPPCFNNRAAA